MVSFLLSLFIVFCQSSSDSVGGPDRRGEGVLTRGNSCFVCLFSFVFVLGVKSEPFSINVSSSCVPIKQESVSNSPSCNFLFLLCFQCVVSFRCFLWFV